MWSVLRQIFKPGSFYLIVLILLLQSGLFWYVFSPQEFPDTLDFWGFHLTDFLLSTGLVILILRRLGLSGLLIVLFSLMLPWLNLEALLLMQAFWQMAVSWPLLASIYLLQRIHAARWGETSTQLFEWLFAALGVLVAWLYPFWMIPISLLVFICLGHWLLGQLGRSLNGWKIAVMMLRILALPWLFFTGILSLSPDSSFFSEGLKGDFYPFRLLELLLPPAHKIISIPCTDSFRSGGIYLGSFGLFFLLYIMLSKWTVKHYSINMSRYSSQTQSGRFLRWLGIGALASLFLSFWNPVYGSTAFWTFQLFMLFFLQRFYLKHPQTWAYILGACLIALSIVDTYDAIRFIQEQLSLWAH